MDLEFYDLGYKNDMLSDVVEILFAAKTPEYYFPDFHNRNSQNSTTHLNIAGDGTSSLPTSTPPLIIISLGKKGRQSSSLVNKFSSSKSLQ